MAGGPAACHRLPELRPEGEAGQGSARRAPRARHLRKSERSGDLCEMPCGPLRRGDRRALDELQPRAGWCARAARSAEPWRSTHRARHPEPAPPGPREGPHGRGAGRAWAPPRRAAAFDAFHGRRGPCAPRSLWEGSEGARRAKGFPTLSTGGGALMRPEACGKGGKPPATGAGGDHQRAGATAPARPRLAAPASSLRFAGQHGSRRARRRVTIGRRRRADP